MAPDEGIAPIARFMAAVSSDTPLPVAPYDRTLMVGEPALRTVAANPVNANNTNAERIFYNVPPRTAMRIGLKVRLAAGVKAQPAKQEA